MARPADAATPLSPPPTYDSILTADAGSPAALDLGPSPPSPAADEPPTEAAPPATGAQTTRSQLVRLSWSSSDGLPSEDEAMALDPPRPSFAPDRRLGSSQIRVVDNSTLAVAGSGPSSSAPLVRAVAIPSYTTLRSVTLFAITLVLCSANTTGAAEEQSITVHRRYSQFRDLHERLARVYPNLQITLGRFPPRSGPRRYDERFLDKRRGRLQEWLAVVLYHPDLGASPLVREWLSPAKDPSRALHEGRVLA